MEFSRQPTPGNSSGLPCPPPEDLLTQGSSSGLFHLLYLQACSLPLTPSGKPPSQITNKWPLLSATYVSVGLCSDRQHIHSPWCSWLHGELPDTVGNSPLTSCFVPIPGLLILWGLLPSPPALSPLQNCSQDLSFWVMVYLAGWHSLPSRPVSGGGETVPLSISPSCPSASMELPPCTGQGWSHLVNSRATVNQKHISVQKRNSSRIVQ